MCLYILIGPGGYISYVYFGFYQFWPNPWVSNIHIPLSVLVCGSAFYCYFKACSTDPGTITKQNWKEYYDKFDKYFDGIMFRKDTMCRTCNIKK
jgi:hypothetical protein